LCSGSPAASRQLDSLIAEFQRTGSRQIIPQIHALFATLNSKPGSGSKHQDNINQPRVIHAPESMDVSPVVESTNALSSMETVIKTASIKLQPASPHTPVLPRGHRRTRQ
jgi:hypothetical protein